MGLFSGISKSLKRAAGGISGGLLGALNNPKAPWLGALGGFAGGAAANYGARGQNKADLKYLKYQQQFNSAEAGISRDHSAKQAQIQRSFQERMSSTSHQREITDLKAAGLNPILSAGGGGSSTPGGAMGATSSASSGLATATDEMAPALNSALAMTMTKANVKNINAKTSLTKAQERAIKPASAAGSAIGSLAEYIKQQGAQSLASVQRAVTEYYRHQSQITSKKN